MTQSWATRPLRQCGRWISGGTPRRSNPTFWGGDIPWISAKSIKQLRLTSSPEQLTQAGGAEVGTVERGTVLFVVRGMSLAKEFRVGVAERTLAFNQDLRAIHPSADVDPYYLARFLAFAAPNVLRMVGDASHGTKRLPTDLLDALPVPLPALSEQKRIAAVLDKADTLRAKRRQALATLDALVQSVFLDMFGDPATNPKGWPKVPLARLCANDDDIRCGPFGTQLLREEFAREGVPLWGIKHVNLGFHVKTDEYVSATKAKALSVYSIEPGDIVMTRKGTIGNCAVYPDGWTPGVMHSDLLRLRVDRGKCHPIFLSHQLHCSQDVEVQLLRISGGAIMQGINVGKLKALTALAPPLPLQSKFVKATQEVATVREKYAGAERTNDRLFASLQSAAFAGTLFDREASKPARHATM